MRKEDWGIDKRTVTQYFAHHQISCMRDRSSGYLDVIEVCLPIGRRMTQRDRCALDPTDYQA